MRPAVCHVTCGSPCLRAMATPSCRARRTEPLRRSSTLSQPMNLPQWRMPSRPHPHGAGASARISPWVRLYPRDWRAVLHAWGHGWHERGGVRHSQSVYLDSRALAWLKAQPGCDTPAVWHRPHTLPGRALGSPLHRLVVAPDPSMVMKWRRDLVRTKIASNDEHYKWHGR